MKRCRNFESFAIISQLVGCQAGAREDATARSAVPVGCNNTLRGRCSHKISLADLHTALPHYVVGRSGVKPEVWQAVAKQ